MGLYLFNFFLVLFFLVNLVPAFYLENLLCCATWDMKEPAHVKDGIRLLHFSPVQSLSQCDQHVISSIKLLTFVRPTQWEGMKTSSTEANNTKKGKRFEK